MARLWEVAILSCTMAGFMQYIHFLGFMKKKWIMFVLIKYHILCGKIILAVKSKTAAEDMAALSH